MAAAVAPRARASASALPVPRRPTVRATPERRIRVASGMVWIVLIAALLVGVVFMNVLVLRLNVRLDRLGREEGQLQDDNAALASQLSSAEAAARIQLQARGAGYVQVAPGAITYVRLRP